LHWTKDTNIFLHEPANFPVLEGDFSRFDQNLTVEAEEAIAAEWKAVSEYIDVEDVTVFPPPPPATPDITDDALMQRHAAAAAQNTVTPEAATPFVSPRPDLLLHPNGVPYLVSDNIEPGPNAGVEANYEGVYRGLIDEPQYGFAPAQAVADAEGYGGDIIQFALDTRWPFTQPGDINMSDPFVDDALDFLDNASSPDLDGDTVIMDYQDDSAQPAGPIQPVVYAGLVAPEAPFRERPRTRVDETVETVDPLDTVMDGWLEPASVDPPASGPPANSAAVDLSAPDLPTMDASKATSVDPATEPKPASGGEDDNLPPPPTNLIRRSTKRKARRVTMPKKKKTKTG
jgi:hypothetical protein